MAEQIRDSKKTCSEAFLFDSEVKWEDIDPGVQRQVMGYDGQLMLVKVKFEKGAIGAPHSHYHSQSSYIASGKFGYPRMNLEARCFSGHDCLQTAERRLILHSLQCHSQWASQGNASRDVPWQKHRTHGLLALKHRDHSLS